MFLNWLLIPQLLVGSYFDLHNNRRIPARYCYMFLITCFLIWIAEALFTPIQAIINLGYALITIFLLILIQKKGIIGNGDVYYWFGISLVIKFYNLFLFFIAGLLILEYYKRREQKTKTSAFLHYITLSFALVITLEAFL